MNPYKKLVLDIALYIVLFVAIQLVVTIALAIGFLLYKGLPFTQLRTLIETDLTLTIAANIVGSALLAVLFCWRKWTPVSRHYVQSRPWGMSVRLPESGNGKGMKNLIYGKLIS